MRKPIILISSLVSIFILSMNCDKINNPSIQKDDLLGYWSESDTSIGSERWQFTDSTVTHFFDRMDTIGNYNNWQIKNDTIILNGGQNKYDKLKYNLLNQYNLHLEYYRWELKIIKDFHKK